MSSPQVPSNAAHIEASDSPSAGTDEQIIRLRHSCAHIMAEAVVSLFPTAKLGIGPPIEDGFYYDFEIPRPLTPDDLPVIEEAMRAIIESSSAFARNELSKEEALRFFLDQPFKRELIEGIPGNTVSTFTQHGFTDLCQGPHVDSTNHVVAFKLLRVAGAYWRGDEHRPQLQRIYGACFPTQIELDA
ncbi:MAG: threonine--tRNA ligase, partial [Chloroflexi bacterium]|nr:threonine--tRNA ligase [Chloroflexota bacterium]